MMRHSLPGCVLALLLVLPGCGSPKTKDLWIEYIDLATLTERMNEAADRPSHLVILDPRPPADYAQAHIPRAVNVRLPELEREDRRHPAIAGREWIVVYGEDPGSAVAKGLTKRLQELRYKKVRMFRGGLKAWLDAGMPVESAPEPPSP